MLYKVGRNSNIQLEVNAFRPLINEKDDKIKSEER